MIIIVTGTPATGKTKVAKEIAKRLEYKYIDVNSIIKENKLTEDYDNKLKSKIVDINKLKKILMKIKGNAVIDSHLSHYLPKKFVDLCIVTKCDLKVLKKRLEKRGYNKEKIRENLNAEIFDVCLIEASEKKHKIMIIDTSKKVDFNKIINKI